MQKIFVTTLFLTTNMLLMTSFTTATIHPSYIPTPAKLAQDTPTDLEIQQKVQQIAKNITVRITAENNGGSGVIVAQKGNTYLILTNAHVVRKSTQLQVQAPDGRKYTARQVDGGFSPKYDLALLTIESTSKYQLPDLSDRSTISVNSRDIYSTGYPFDSKDLRITSGQVSQLSDLPFDNGTQIGYTIDKGKKGIRQGMSGGPIFDAAGHLLGINTIGAAPILPDYTYNDGSKPLAKLAAKYREANWGIPIYNFLTNVKADILYGYDNLPKVEHQVTPTGFMAQLNDKARKMTVRIENSGGNGSGVIIAKEGSTYYVLTAKHVVRDLKIRQNFLNSQIITYDQDRHSENGVVVAEGADLAVVKFSSNSNYPLARLGNYSQNSDLMFVGGFPARAKINSPLWQWQLNPGYVAARQQGKLNAQDNQSFSEGYDLIYSSISYGGMSGGPVFDTAGNVIGIHGKAEGTGEQAVILGKSLGISIQTFLGLAAKLQIPSQLLTTTKTNPVALSSGDLNNVIATMENLTQPQEADNGERWLAYGNQLYRTRQLDRSVIAFDKAIAKGQILLGNYGKALSLFVPGTLDKAQVAIAKAIAAIPPDRRSSYYYFWRKQNVIYADSQKYDEALIAINIAIGLNPNDPVLYTEKAYGLSRQKKYAEVIAIYDALIPKYPEAYAYYGRGNAKRNSGDNQGAIADYTQAIKIDPGYKQAYNNRGAVKADLGYYQEAAIDFSQVISMDFNDSMAYHNRGVTKSKLGNKQGAIDDYTQAIKIDPNYTDAYVNRGLAKSSLGDNREAIIDYNRAINLNPKDADNYVHRGTAKFKLGDSQAAIIDFDRAIALAPKDADNYNNRGAAKFELGKIQEAISDFDRAIALAPKNASAYYNRGTAKSNTGDRQGAIIDFDRAIALDPKYTDAYLNRGNAKSRLGYQQEAILDFDRAIAIDPQFSNAYSKRGMSKFYLEKTQDAIVDLNRAISLDPKNASAYQNRGGIKVSLGRIQEAIIDFDRAIALAPKEAANYNNRGAAKSILGNKQDAIIDFDRAIALDPTYASAYRNRGLAKSDIGRKQDAVVDYNRAIALNPKDAEAYYHRGNAKFELGEKQAAINDYDRAIALDRKYADAYSNRGSLKCLLGNNSGAMIDMDRAIAINPNFAGAYNNRGFLKIIIGREKDALSDLESAIKLNPKQGESYACRGFIKETSGDKQGAIIDYQQAIKLDPQLVTDWKKQAESLRTSNPASYQKLQQMIEKLAAGSK
ncbi:tetratricopeptide repeat protein [Chamaesiphon sp. GL140_3_metabinner_50]|uniref:tetratricopeptide repeat protein n=1 Tax=Chamaesiphon sp. GL140_3_metabinner_50 TaxID=2970812 RepID=UPI0025DED882|nr:tetratricopeptide repeat protein [Chamaesiphon sp. GL140_3_metabinner_50]